MGSAASLEDFAALKDEGLLSHLQTIKRSRYLEHSMSSRSIICQILPSANGSGSWWGTGSSWDHSGPGVDNFESRALSGVGADCPQILLL